MSVRNNKTLKLAKLSVQKFWGDPRQWNEFQNSFESSTYKNETLSKIEKFVPLKSFLAAPASNVMLGFKLIHINYDSCVALYKKKGMEEKIY